MVTMRETMKLIIFVKREMEIGNKLVEPIKSIASSQ